MASQSIAKTRAWRPWTLDGKKAMGGYVIEWRDAEKLFFATARGSGHMLPEFVPRKGHALLYEWIENNAFKAYTP